MRIIISPAKEMRADGDTLLWQDLPQFLPQAEVIYHTLQTLSYAALKALWRCNDKIVSKNVERLKTVDLYKNLTPAILAYVGIQYQYMAPNVFTQEAYAYVQEHLRMVSALYGLLRPFDGVAPHRLEMQTRLQVGSTKDLYAYWGSKIAEQIYQETDCVVDLASQEYSRCISHYYKPGTKYITYIFGEKIQGKILAKGTYCKMARGEMVRYLAEGRIENLEDIKNFSGLNYIYEPRYSNESTFVFVLKR